MSWTGLRTCAFYDNFAKLFFYPRQPDGSRTWSDNLGTAPLQTHAVADIGESAARAQHALLVAALPFCLAARPHHRAGLAKKFWLGQAWFWVLGAHDALPDA